ncbi:hypothetical protein HMPREF0555_0286 [Leuconostoc mesenteroides subsp. cremoris ATCC 19254]|uniref:Uncharacterized protein n=1 Tax=Leuconostoc mesenteroides subsp. cremoris ATCC 19254 TaxID=586220 RepID=C2KI20_LEUMC|nr:hypothetical protein HMPREF0555_0286 [Leuconostoc mesenteroides subsp. cremoris ATCC 19254]
MGCSNTFNYHQLVKILSGLPKLNIYANFALIRLIDECQKQGAIILF